MAQQHPGLPSVHPSTASRSVDLANGTTRRASSGKTKVRNFGSARMGDLRSAPTSGRETGPKRCPWNGSWTWSPVTTERLRLTETAGTATPTPRGRTVPSNGSRSRTPWIRQRSARIYAGIMAYLYSFSDHYCSSMEAIVEFCNRQIILHNFPSNSSCYRFPGRAWIARKGAVRSRLPQR